MHFYCAVYVHAFIKAIVSMVTLSTICVIKYMMFYDYCDVFSVEIMVSFVNFTKLFYNKKKYFVSNSELYD